MWDLPANSALNQSKTLGPWHSGQALSVLRCIAYFQGSLTDWDQKPQIFLMKASFKNYPILVSLKDKMEHRKIALPTVVHSQVLSGMVGLWLWVPGRLHWVGEAVQKEHKKSRDPNQHLCRVSPQCCYKELCSGWHWPELHHQRCWVLKGQFKPQLLFLFCWLSSWNFWLISYILQCWPK